MAAIPNMAVVLGSGLRTFGERLEDSIEIPYHDVANWPVPRVAGHGANLILGRLANVRVAFTDVVGYVDTTGGGPLFPGAEIFTFSNPGGFGEEFRALYYPPAVTMALALGAIALASMGAEYRTWAMICMWPLALAGLALVHSRVAARGQGKGWLTGFYLAWLIFDPIKLFVVFAAIADSWFNFRQRWTGKPGTDVSERDSHEDQSDEDRSDEDR